MTMEIGRLYFYGEIQTESKQYMPSSFREDGLKQ